jgi:FkbM family methyltransferase
LSQSFEDVDKSNGESPVPYPCSKEKIGSKRRVMQMKADILVIQKNGVQFNVEQNLNRMWVWDLILKNKWEEETFQIFDRFLNPSHTYLDIGAWIGPTVLYGAHKAKHVYAIEPDPVAYQELVENLALNPDISSKVTCLQTALSGVSETMPLYMREQFGDSTSSIISTREDQQYLEVRGMTIEELITEKQIEDVNFVKLDIEAGEYVVIPFLQQYLQKYRPTLYLSIHPKFLSEQLRFMEKEDLLPYTRAMLDSLKFYKYIYDAYGKQVNEETVINVTSFDQFVFTDEQW